MNENQKKTPVYLDFNRSFEERVEDLIGRMTLKEKILQMCYSAPEIKRLKIPRYHWWNECLHGVGRAGIATVFPQAIGLAATFNPRLIFEIAKVISTEARAKHHEFVRQGDRGRYKGLTFWSPNINIFRDPRWGRGQETYGEDPYLAGRLGVAFVKGLQGDDPKYLKVVATPKHFAVHSGPEKLRHKFNVLVSPKDLHETYLPAFRACAVEGGAESVMCAYNRVNGKPACANDDLLQKILRDKWNFKGYVVSDCGAIDDFHRIGGHKFTKNKSESAAIAVKNGCDLNCGNTFKALKKAVKKGLITEKEINGAVKRLFLARFKLGMFDPPEMVKYANIPYSLNDSEEHRQLALHAARQSIVLLKNEDSLLPLDDSIKDIAIVGPNSDLLISLLGNYEGTPSKYSTPLDGIRNKAKKLGINVQFERGCDFKKADQSGFDDAIKAVNDSDITIACMGINPKMEGEQRLVGGDDDRMTLELPKIQQDFLKNVKDSGKPVILILLNGSPIAIPWAQKNVPAILEAWYPGEEGGNAIADIMFGEYSPASRLPITFHESTLDLPDFSDYSMKGRTYRYLTRAPLFPFGFGLSYSSFKYSKLTLSSKEIQAGSKLTVSVTVKNVGMRASDEVIQLYLRDLESSVETPKHSLQGVKRIHLKKGETKIVKFDLIPRQMAVFTNDGECMIEPGEFQIWLGGHQPDDRSKELLPRAGLMTDTFRVTGNKILLPA
ncbi:MAG: glycoside hydrolase family 3 C-terminal domain-containing protein [Promethearchaeota archaeon]